MKQCSKCKEFLSENHFTKRGESDKLRSHCRKCINERNLSRYYIGDKVKRRKTTYKYNLRVNYNLDVDNYNKLYQDQKGCCAICETPLENIFLGIEGVSSSLDHSHLTGKNRQLLCRYCNTGLGSFRDNPIYLNKAIKYLEKHCI